MNRTLYGLYDTVTHSWIEAGGYAWDNPTTAKRKYNAHASHIYGLAFSKQVRVEVREVVLWNGRDIDRLINDSEVYHRLVAHGVDNWCGYDDAVSIHE